MANEIRLDCNDKGRSELTGGWAYGTTTYLASSSTFSSSIISPAVSSSQASTNGQQQHIVIGVKNGGLASREGAVRC